MLRESQFFLRGLSSSSEDSHQALKSYEKFRGSSAHSDLAGAPKALEELQFGTQRFFKLSRAIQIII